MFLEKICVSMYRYTVSSLFLVSNSVVHTITHGEGREFFLCGCREVVEKIVFSRDWIRNETRKKKRTAALRFFFGIRVAELRR